MVDLKKIKAINAKYNSIREQAKLKEQEEQLIEDNKKMKLQLKDLDKLSAENKRLKAKIQDLSETKRKIEEEEDEEEDKVKGKDKQEKGETDEKSSI